MSKVLFPEYGTSHVSYALEKLFGTSAARLLQQIHYWHENDKSAGYVCSKGLKWVYNTAVDWGKQINRSKETVYRAVDKLVSAGVILVDKPKASTNRDQTNHYLIDYKTLKKLLRSEGAIPGKTEPEHNDHLEKPTMTSSSLSSVPTVIQRVPTETTYKDFAAEAPATTGATEAPVAQNPEKKKNVDFSSPEKAVNPLMKRLSSFMSKVSKTNDHQEYYTDPGEEVAEKTKAAIFQQIYGEYADMSPETAVKSLCSRYLSKKHNPFQDKKHIEALCDWLKSDPNQRLKPLVDAFRAIKTAQANVHTASYVLRGLSSVS